MAFAEARTMPTRGLPVVLSLALSTGCFLGDDLGPVDDEIGIDNHTPELEPAPATRCAVSDDMGAMGALEGVAKRHNQSGTRGELRAWRAETATIVASSGAQFKMALGLWDQQGVFAGQVETGVFDIAAQETSIEDCGACLYLLVSSAAPVVAETIYLARSGSLELVQLLPELQVAIANVTLAEIDSATGKPRVGGCETRIASASFAAEVTCDNGGGGGGPGNGGDGSNNGGGNGNPDRFDCSK